MSRYRLALAASVLILVALGAVLLVTVDEVGVRLNSYTNNAGELTSEVLVGQTFVSPRDQLSGVAVMFATYSGRENRQAIEFHLRESFEARQDLRVVSVEPSDLGDNQLHRFEFEAIEKSGGQSYFWYVLSPASRVGDAVTVDLDNRDPYPDGTAFLARNIKVGDEIGGEVGRAGKQSVDVAFATYHEVPLGQHLVRRAKSAVSWLVVTWPERRTIYSQRLVMAVPAIGLVVMLWWLIRRPTTLTSARSLRWSLAIIFLLALAARLIYAAEFPLTNDEGNYLYDARTLLRGELAGGDGYVKAPVVIVWISFWQLLLGNTILAGRWSSILVGALALFPIYVIGAQMRNRATGLMAAAIWALLGVTTVFNIYVHTQPVAIFFGLSGIALLWHSLHKDTVSGKQLVIAGLLLGLGVASRKSVLALGLIPLLLILVESETWRTRGKRLLLVGVGFVLVIAVLLSFAALVYGEQGLWEVTGFNSAEDSVTADPIEVARAKEYSLRGMTPFFRESLPLIFLALLGWGIALESLALTFVSKSTFSNIALRLAGVKIVWLLPIGALWWAASFFFEYEGEPFVSMGGVAWLWYLFGALLIAIALLPAEPWVSRAPRALRAPRASLMSRVAILAALISPLWLGGLIFFYINWIKFHANYLGEFLAPLVVLAGLGAYLGWQRISLIPTKGSGTASTSGVFDVSGARAFGRATLLSVFILSILWSVYLTSFITYTYEHTGTFKQEAVIEAAEWVRKNIPLSEQIFTGAGVIPYLSGHQAVLNIAHPRWYAYQWIREDTDRINTFLPSSEEMVQAFRDSNWFIWEKQTGFSYIMEYSEIERGIEQDFEQVHAIENGSNTLVFYKRIRQAQ